MKKEEFNYLYSFKYKGKDYVFLTSKNYPFYFLEYNFKTKNFDYPDIETFKDLFNKFHSTNNILAFNKEEGFKKLRGALSKAKLKIKPLVKASTGGLLALSLALSMCGCIQIPRHGDPSQTTSIVSMEESTRQNEIQDYFADYDLDVTSRDYDGNDYIFIEEYLNESNHKIETTIHNVEQFREIMEIDFIPSWDDVEAAFKENESIDDEKKQIILEGLNNMRESEDLKGMDLSVLYVNAKRMNFKYLTSDEITENAGKESVYSYFDTNTGTVYLPSDKPLEKFEFTHEVLGHGSLAYREVHGNHMYVFDCTNNILLPTDDTYTGYTLGSMVSEGGANMIAHIATKDYSVESFYELYEEELRAIAELCHVSLGELFNHKGINLYDLMYKNNINSPVEYIFKMDAIMRGKQYCEFSDLMECLFRDATEEDFVRADSKKQDEIIRDTVAIIKNSHFKDKGGLHFKHSTGSIDYMFDDVANDYEQDMNSLRTSK